MNHFAPIPATTCSREQSGIPASRSRFYPDSFPFCAGALSVRRRAARIVPGWRTRHALRLPYIGRKMTAPSSLKAILGPTNTGKTYFAIERMLAHRSGMIGLPLRLLAREVYARVADRVGEDAVALVTGEERIVPPKARYWVATVEAMPLDMPVECLAVDEIQVATDFDRGHVFTNRILKARGLSETLLLGAGDDGAADPHAAARCRDHPPAALLDADLCRAARRFRASRRARPSSPSRRARSMPSPN